MASELTLDEQKAVAQLKEAVAPEVEKHSCLRYFVRNEHTYVRFLRARQWNLAKAIKMLQATLEWRLSFKPHELTWDIVKTEAGTGKQQVYDWVDNAGRPIVMMRPRKENTKDADKQINFLIYHLELASTMADDSGVGKMTWCLDFNGYSLLNAPPLKMSLHCNSILQNHYPERLGMALCYHAPLLFTMTWRAVSPFVDAVTKAKIFFVNKNPKEAEQMREKMPLEKMDRCMGGDVEDTFDLPSYEVRMLAHDAVVKGLLQQATDLHNSGGGGGGGSLVSSSGDSALLVKQMEGLHVLAEPLPASVKA
ncbi:MAG: hypothetical protein WDW36_004635 [Sanguina aurantia]